MVTCKQGTKAHVNSQNETANSLQHAIKELADGIVVFLDRSILSNSV